MSNVVNLSTKKNKDRRQAAKLSDKRLIQECVIFAQSMAAFRVGFSVDPDGNNTTAEKLGCPMQHRGYVALANISKMPARTAAGLQAKSHIVPILIEDAHGGMDEREEEFFLSFAADVKTFLQPIIEQAWLDERASNREAKS